MFIYQEGLNSAVEYSMHIGNGHAIVSYRDIMFFWVAKPVHELAVGHHASATLDDKGIFFYQAGNCIQSCHVVKLQLFAGEICQPPGDLHPADIVT